MTSFGSINFTDRNSGDDAWIGVRVSRETIGLASSLKANGDIEVFLGQTEAEALCNALTEAIAAIRG